MAAGGKHIAVVVRAARAARVAEALRAAVGLGLRGDRVTALLATEALRLAAAVAPSASDSHSGRGDDRSGHGDGHSGHGDDRSGHGDGHSGPAIARAVATLRMLGHSVAPFDDEAAAALRDADAVQVWT